MKRIKVAMCILTIILSVLGRGIILNASEGRIILIDPGHGGQDGGAVGIDNTLEKDLNLKVSKKLGEILKQRGYEIVMTRDDDIDLHAKEGSIRNEKRQDLKLRCELKETSKCHMFVSIHMNKFTDGKVKGPHVYFSSNEKSKVLGEIIIKNLVDNLGYERNPHAKDAKNSYRILRNPGERPEVIVECGFLSNKGDLEKLKDDEHQNKIVLSIANSIDEYFKLAK